VSSGLIPQRAALAISELLDNCARIRAGQHILLLAAVDGLHGGRNLVDEQAIAWITMLLNPNAGKPTRRVKHTSRPGTAKRNIPRLPLD